MSRSDDTLRLRDMLDAAQAAIRVLGDRTAEQLENAEVLSLAVPHAVEIVSEAASRVSRPFCEAHPEIAWSAVTGMRHRIVHDYFAVDYQRYCSLQATGMARNSACRRKAAEKIDVLQRGMLPGPPAAT